MRVLTGFVVVVMLAVGLGGAGCAALSDREATVASADYEVAMLVMDRLQQDAATARAQVGVSASGGVVTLRGFVRGEPERLRALGIARGTPGVAEVIDQLRIYK